MHFYGHCATHKKLYNEKYLACVPEKPHMVQRNIQADEKRENEILNEAYEKQENEQRAEEAEQR